MNDLDPELYIGAYSKFAERRNRDRSYDLEPSLNYESFLLKNDHEIGKQHFFCAAATDYARTLINEINHFGGILEHIQLWNPIIANYDKHQQFLLTLEFIETPLSYALSRPYALRSRFIFVAINLGRLYQANLSKQSKPFAQHYDSKEMTELIGDWAGFQDFNSAWKNSTIRRITCM